MAEISLRAYVKEVDDLIEQGQNLDEAIAHCRRILGSHPKHLETYRLLGKAYLEAKRYSDAADIFQRVLSSVPDDFVAHVGMALVREDEGNLDSAIWHMERAFETSPGNAAIQQELRRLIGRRDGLEPPKVRLSRGALAHMYAHGEIYPEAINELRSALQEDPDRPDLQVLLAEIYWRSDQRHEAAELSKRILDKLPFCFSANRITASLLQASGRGEEASIYQRRLVALDPYYGYLASSAEDPKSVDAAAIRLEKLAWKPGQPLPAIESRQPDWAASLGIDMRDQKKAGSQATPAPPWVGAAQDDTQRGQPQPASQPTPAIHPFAGAETPQGVEMPNWMREFGWTEATGEAKETSIEYTDEELESGLPKGPPPQRAESELGLPAGVPASEGPLAPAAIPDWLRELAPEQPALQTTAAPPAAQPEAEGERAAVTDWLQDVTPAEPSLPIDGIRRAAPGGAAAETGAVQEIPSATPSRGPVEEVAPERRLLGAEGEAEAEFLPWLEEAAPGATETIVTWLGDKSSPTPTSPPVDVPEWMSGTGPLGKDKARPTIPSIEPVPLREAPTESVPTPEPAAEEPSEGWLSQLAASVVPEPAVPQPTSGVTPYPTDQGEPIKALDWLQPTDTAREAPAPAMQTPADQLDTGRQVPPPSAEGAPDWLAALVEGPEAPPTGVETAPAWLQDGSAQPTEAPLAGPAPDWLQGLTDIEKPQAAADVSPPGDTLDWLSGLAQEAPQSAAPVEGPAAWFAGLEATADASGPPATAGPTEEVEWLRGLPEATTPAEGIPDEAALEPPAWLKPVAEEKTEVVAAAGVEAPDWLVEIAKSEMAIPSQPPDVEQAPQWLSEPPAEQSAPAPEPAALAESPRDWLSEQESVQAAAPSESLAAEAAMPDWLATSGMAEEPPSPAPGPSETAAPDWLLDFGEVRASPTADETLPSAEAPVEPSFEGALDWLQDSAKEVLPEPPSADETVIGAAVAGAEVIDLGTADRLDEEDVFRYLEGLAARQGVDEAQLTTSREERTTELPSSLQGVESEALWIKDSAIPDEPGEGLEWLDRLAGVARSEESSTPIPVADFPELTEEDVTQPEMPSLAESTPAPAPEAEPFGPPVIPLPEDLTWPFPEEADLTPPQTGAMAAPETELPLPLPERAVETPELPSLEWAPPSLDEPGEPEPPPQPAFAAVDLAPTVPPSMPPRVQAPPEAIPPSSALPSPQVEQPLGAEHDAELEALEWLEATAQGAGVGPRLLSEEPAAVVPEAIPSDLLPAEEPGPTLVTPYAEVHPLPPEAPPLEQPKPPVAAEPPVVVAPPVARPPQTGRLIADPRQVLEEARRALAAGSIPEALRSYGRLIKLRLVVDQVIADLREALEQGVDGPAVWQTLGDAYLRVDRLTEAIQAYRHGLETA